MSRADGRVHELFPVAIPASEGLAIRTWVERELAAAPIEVGLGYGLSALFVCEALLEIGNAGTRHVVMDPHQDRRFGRCGLQVLDEAGVAARVEFHGGPSELVLPQLLGEGRRFDFAVVDGSHRFDSVFVDLFYLGRLLRPGSVVFLDDSQLPGIVRAAAFFVTNLDWAVEEVSTVEAQHHWSVLRTARGPDRRSFDSFVEF